MSCGKPHATACADVIKEVYDYLDGECNDERRNLIRDHLDECSPCLRQFGIEQEVKILVARCCGGDRAPAHLKLAVLKKLRYIRLELDQVEYRAE